MKLMRVGPKGAEKPALLDKEGTLRDLSGVIADITGRALTDESLASLVKLDPASLPRIEGSPRIGAPVGGIGKVIGIALNYHDHARDAGKEIPAEPIMFFKPSHTVIGPNDTVRKPKTAQKLDWECEFAIAIGKEGRNIPESQALAHVAGWILVNDYTERWFAGDRGGGLDKGKSGDDFTPLGPWLVTKDEIADINALHMWCEVNGKRYQDSSSREQAKRPAYLISHISEFMTLHPGDVILTGTPSGIGALQKPPVFLNPGDVVHLGVEGLGEQKQKIV